MDTLLKDGIADDAGIFDWSFTGTIVHNLKNQSINFDTGVVTINTETFTLDNCIFRNAATRNDTSIKQLHQRDVSLQVDQFDAVDRVVEVPIPQDPFSITQGDKFIDEDENEWRIIAIDLCTLGTRYRLGLKVFV